MLWSQPGRRCSSLSTGTMRNAPNNKFANRYASESWSVRAPSFGQGNRGEPNRTVLHHTQRVAKDNLRAPRLEMLDSHPDGNASLASPDCRLIFHDLRPAPRATRASDRGKQWSCTADRQTGGSWRIPGANEMADLGQGQVRNVFHEYWVGSKPIQ